MPAEEALNQTSFAEQAKIFDEINQEQQEENEDIYQMV